MLLFVIWYIAFKWVIGGVSDDSWRSILMFYPKAFAGLLVLLFILNVRRAELDANQKRRNRRSTEAIADALGQVAAQTPTQRNAPKFSLYLRLFASTNQQPVQFDHGPNTIIAERIDLESILQRSLGRSGLFRMNAAAQVVASEPLNLRDTLRRVRKVRRIIRSLQS